MRFPTPSSSPPTDADRLAAQAAAIGPASLVRTIDELAAALTAIREGDDARMAIEIALLKAARPDLDPSTEGLMRRIERLEGGGPRAVPQVRRRRTRRPVAGEQGIAPAGEAQARAEPVAAEEPRPPGGEPKVAAEEPQPPGGEPKAQSPGTPAALDVEQVKRVWPAVLDELKQTAPALAATFEGARPVKVGRRPAGRYRWLSRGSHIQQAQGRGAGKARTGRSGAGEGAGRAAAARLCRPRRRGGARRYGNGKAVDAAELVERIKSEFDAEEV